MAHKLTLRVKSLLGDERFRFLAVGGFNTFFGLLVFYVLEFLVGESIGYFLVLILTFVLILLSSFFLYRWLVFKAKGNLGRDFVRFASVYTIPFTANAVALPLLVTGLGWLPTVAQTVIVIFSTLFSYFGHKYFSFRRSK